MSNHRQTILASRPAAMVLALSLVAGLTAPFVMLPRAQAAVTPLACTENNHNGCTELSPTPPEDTVAVPPNIMLMLDDSGSMKSDYMPDFGYLQNNGNNDALIDAANNGVYYNPATTYAPPPKADSTTASPDLYPAQTDMTNVLQDGFGVRTTASVNLYTYDGSYECDHNNNCGNGTPGSGQGKIDFNIMVLNASASLQTYDETVNATYENQCVSGRPSRGQDGCNYKRGGRNSGHYANVLTEAADAVCTDTFNSISSATGTLVFTGKDKDNDGNWTDGECKFNFHAAYFFQYSTGPKAGPYVVHYVTAVAADCAYAPTPGNCVADSASSGFKDASGKDIPVATNVANWFSYNHTRILMAKSGLMAAFLNLSPKYRFGYGSINTSGVTAVSPFGDGTAGTRKAAFWTWIASKSANNSTPLRRALQRVGEYYRTQQPWTSMAGDPGYSSTGTNTPYACRASYTILTTDGFWNGGDPYSIGNDKDGKPLYVTGAADANGPTYSPPAGSTYTVTGYVAQAPFSGGAAQSGGDPIASLADVATYYWETDLQDGSTGTYNLANEVAPSTADPAFWQHMTTYTVGLGVDPTGIKPDGTTKRQIFDWAHDGGGTSSSSAITGFSWPTPYSNSINNIADLEHAGVNGHGDFFSVKSPEDMTKSFTDAFADIGSRVVLPSTASVNASVFTTGAVSFGTGYNTGNWSGTLEGKTITLNSDGTVAYGTGWIAGAIPPGETGTDTLQAFHSSTGYADRKVYTGAYKQVKDAGGVVTSNTFDAGFQFNVTNKASLDSFESAALMIPASTGANDTLDHRINYLLGDNTYEDGKVYRTRTTLLGAIIRSQPVYVSYAAGNYYDRWPNNADGTTAAEAGTAAQKYDAFVTQEATRPARVYIGANDGMLHAFNAPVPTCTTYTAGVCSKYDFGTDSGKEQWAFIPRAVYANLGNLTSLGFSYRPTVDETPVTRDVFFSDDKWHTLLAGGVGLGGRGVYALDISSPTGAFTAANVLWEFDADATPDSKCAASYGTCKATDLGYTVSKPNISRLHNGKWAVLVSNGYFPDCTTPDTPTNDVTNCQAIAAQAPKNATDGNKPYSALFVLDAQTGKMIAELKTPTDITGVTSFGLASAVLGDYNSDQIADVAFAGDVQGNLWRFNLKSSDPSKWTVTLAYKGLAVGGVQGQQPITSMPHLFPDTDSSLFMVTFGTGKFLGVGDNSNNTVQTIYGVRDQGDSATSAKAYEQSDLVQQYMHEEVESTFLADGTTPNPLAGVTVRCVTGGASDTCDSGSATAVNDSSSSGGWFINLKTTAKDGTQTDAGERVVVNPGAIFASNTVIFETLITGSANSDPCSPSTVGAILALNAVTGGPSGVSSLGGWPIVGGRITSARTSGSLPVVSALGGGQVYLPGTGLAPNGKKPVSLDAPIWRRRSWQEINQNQ